MLLKYILLEVLGAGAVTFRSKEDLLMAAQKIPFGTIIVLLDAIVLHVRVGDGLKENLESIELT